MRTIKLWVSRSDNNKSSMIENTEESMHPQRITLLTRQGSPFVCFTLNHHGRASLEGLLV